MRVAARATLGLVLLIGLLALSCRVWYARFDTCRHAGHPVVVCLLAAQR